MSNTRSARNLLLHTLAYVIECLESERNRRVFCLFWLHINLSLNQLHL